jgi:hypothetical protein
LLPYTIAKDARRDFTEEQRQYVWDMSPDKRCAICNKTVEWNDYECDHKKPHTKGGQTIVANGQITHRFHNRSKGG